jgi:predicted HAD superfamily Cof-like phosphohydrolase
MIEALKMVEEFHRTFSQPVIDTPQIPDKERCILRISLIREELNELQKAIADDDITEVADALCDLQYVLAGTVLEFGMGGLFKDMFEAVHESNMSKACSTPLEASDTLNYHLLVHDVFGKVEQVGGKYVVKRDDGKVLKSINYKPVDLKRFLTGNAINQVPYENTNQ